MTLSPEGDVHISDETLQGLGTIKRFLRLFFASLLLVNYTVPISQHPVHMATSIDEPSILGTLPAHVTAPEPLLLPPVDWNDSESIKHELIACVPSTGYFAAGGLAGLISRTSTAPLDRLKVYLIAHVEAQSTRELRGGNLRTFTTSLVNATKDLWAAGGMRSLYAGKWWNIMSPKFC